MSRNSSPISDSNSSNNKSPSYYQKKRDDARNKAIHYNNKSNTYEDRYNKRILKNRIPEPEDIIILKKNGD